MYILKNTSCYLRKVSWYKGQKIQTAYPIERHHCRCIEATSTSKKCTKSYVVKAVSGELFESESQDPSPKSLLASAKDSLNTFIRFIRPVALMASVIKIICISLIAVENLSDISPTYFIGLFKALAVILPINIYVVGVNHLADYEIDKDIPDTEGDKKFGIRSASVLLGQEKGLGYAFLASILWHRAKSIDVKDRAATESFYVFLWKGFASYL
ncbi:hypothetical protein Fmac_008229 [Flemingia macrophylla]|uniref:Uncharacterized protein n=1 Tax=Flemingia macrophylla TaxID=520843 RepID=A0ABD1MWW5_9FABA